MEPGPPAVKVCNPNHWTTRKSPKNFTNRNAERGYGEKKTLLPCWWECKLVHTMKHSMEVPRKTKNKITISSAQFSLSVMSDSLWPHGLQHIRLLCLSPTPRACSNSCPSSWWCHITISSSAVPFSSHFQSFLASGSFPMSQFFTSGGQSIGVSASVLPMNIQDWLTLGFTGLISFQYKQLSRVFSNTTVQKDQFFGVQLSL